MDVEREGVRAPVLFVFLNGYNLPPSFVAVLVLCVETTDRAIAHPRASHCELVAFRSLIPLDRCCRSLLTFTTPFEKPMPKLYPPHQLDRHQPQPAHRAHEELISMLLLVVATTKRSQLESGMKAPFAKCVALS